MAAKHRQCIWGFVVETHGVCSIQYIYIYIYIFFLIGDLIPGMPESEGFRGTELGNGEDGWVFSRNKNDQSTFLLQTFD